MAKMFTQAESTLLKAIKIDSKALLAYFHLGFYIFHKSIFINNYVYKLIYIYNLQVVFFWS